LCAKQYAKIPYKYDGWQLELSTQKCQNVNWTITHIEQIWWEEVNDIYIIQPGTINNWQCRCGSANITAGLIKKNNGYDINHFATLKNQNGIICLK